MKGWDWDAFFYYLHSPYLINGAWNTIWLTVVSMLIGIVLGLIAALMRMSDNKYVRAPADFYIWLWRGTPLLVQLIIIYTGLPQLGLRLNVIQSALLGLGVNTGAYLSEIIRAGIMSVNQGQFDAARALGMDYWTLMRVVIMPQAARIMVPPLGNRFNGLLKTSSLASVISMEELLRRSQMLTQQRFAVLEIFSVAAIYYLIMTSAWGLIQNRLEAHFGRAYAPSAARRAKEDEVDGESAEDEGVAQDIEKVLLEQDAR
jgi:polar amino acid transport system permease protein